MVQVHCTSMVWPTLGSRATKEQKSCYVADRPDVDRRRTGTFAGSAPVSLSAPPRSSLTDVEASILWSHHEEKGSCLEKEIMQGTVPGARRRGRPRTAWMDNIKTWTRLPVEESIRMTEDRDKWRKYVGGVANARIEDG